MLQQLLSINDARSVLGIGRTKVYELIAEGDLRLVKIGRKSLITAVSIEALVSRLSSTSDAKAIVPSQARGAVRRSRPAVQEKQHTALRAASTVRGE